MDIFPLFPEIAPNVEFWKNIYSRYDLSQGVIHDKNDPGIVYEVVSLDHPDSYKARKKNNSKVDRIRKNLRQILLKLARGGTPATSEERRVRDLFGDNATRERFRDAADAIRVQLGQKDRFRNGVIRSGAFLKRIKKIFREEGVPSDLAYLAHVESSYNVNAYSKFGAAGIWQFTRSTGKLYMKIDYTIDERRDPIIASRAAARFLKDNYRKLGSWPLAITAYNHGVGGMTRAQKKHGGYEDVFRDFDGRGFGFASKNFYSEFLAAREVARDYRKYFGDLPLDSPWPTREVKMDGYADPAALAEHLGVELGLLRKYNPALRSPVFEGQKYIPRGYSLRLPSDSADLVRLAADLPEDVFSGTQKRSLFYEVRRGDTASSIARMHGVSLQELVLANQLNRSATIYAGQNLRLPTLGTEMVVLSKSYKTLVAAESGEPSAEVTEVAMVALPPAEEITVPDQVEAEPDRPIITAAMEDMEEVARGPELAGNPPQSEELVREGEGVARDNSAGGQDLIFGIQEFLFAGNGNSIQPPLLAEENGTPEVAVQDEDGALFLIDINPQVVTGQLQITRVYSNKGGLFGVIKVEAEETLGHYADWLGIPTWRIRKENRLRYGKAIMVGQEIRIPLRKGGQGLFEEKRYEYHKELV
ncbi:MAG: transglycosylase SLT domain-containing protein, partial [Proteobacteria bacterium]|nr:transglycosylase SLT domain-containing protein [Pseudomonadota bacterium]